MKLAKLSLVVAAFALAICLIYGRPIVWRVAIAGAISGALIKLIHGDSISDSFLTSGLAVATVLGTYLAVRVA